jgi:hypothetical protein
MSALAVPVPRLRDVVDGLSPGAVPVARAFAFSGMGVAGTLMDVPALAVRLHDGEGRLARSAADARG